jgi:hypothetical protein
MEWQHFEPFLNIKDILTLKDYCRTIERERDWCNVLDVLLSISSEYM